MVNSIIFFLSIDIKWLVTYKEIYIYTYFHLSSGCLFHELYRRLDKGLIYVEKVTNQKKKNIYF